MTRPSDRTTLRPMGPGRRIGLFLARLDETQQGWLELARAEARRTECELVEYCCEDDAARQNHQISESIWKDLVDALLILPLRLGGPAALLSHAVSRGKPVVLLERTANDMNAAVDWSLPRLRMEHPGMLVARVAADEAEIGRIQGRQTRTLVPGGGTVLYVQGDTMTSGAVDRTRGFEELLAGDKAFRIGKVDGGWSAARAETAVSEWLSLVLIDAQAELSLVVSQSEMMLPGVRAALARFAREKSRPEMLRVRLTGCDGLAAFKREVESGLLAATIEIPARTPPAIRLVATTGRPAPCRRTPRFTFCPCRSPASRSSLARRAGPAPEQAHLSHCLRPTVSSRPQDSPRGRLGAPASHTAPGNSHFQMRPRC